MSTATLTSDSDLAAPSRLSAWAPVRLMQAVATGLRRPVRWPFSSGASRDHGVSMPPAAVPDCGEALSADRAPPCSPGANGHAAPAVVPSANPAAPHARSRSEAMQTEGLALHSQSLGTAQVCQPTLTLRQKIVDILLVAVWGALIPGLMWLGAAAGF